MSARENLITWLGIGAGAALVCFVGYVFVWSPLEDAYKSHESATKALADADQKLTQQQKANRALLELSPRLAMANELSLPPKPKATGKPSPLQPLKDREASHANHLVNEYKRYLRAVLSKAGLKIIGEVKWQPAPTQTASQKKIAPPFEPMTFTVAAEGKQGELYAALSEFYATPLLHTLKNVTAEVAKPKDGRKEPDPNVLTVNLTVEALVLRTGKERDDLLPEKLPKPLVVLASNARDYSLLEKRSLFTGLQSPPPPPKDKPKDPPKKEEPKDPGPPPITESERLEVLEFVKLTTIVYNPGDKDRAARWEAYFYDQAKGKGQEMRVAERGPFRKFEIENDEGRVVWKGEARFIGWPVRVGDDEKAPKPELEMILEADKKFYRARVGDFLDQVYKHPIPDEEAIELGLLKVKKK